MLVGPFGLPGIALAIAIAAWGEAIVLIAILRARLAHFWLGGMAAGRRRVASPAAPSPGSRRGGFSTAPATRSAADPGRLVLLVELAVVSAAFGAVYALVSAALRIPELPSIVGVMVDVFRRPVRS